MTTKAVLQSAVIDAACRYAAAYTSASVGKGSDEACGKAHDALRNEVALLAAEPERKPITIEQLRALPEWWPSFDDYPVILALVRAVECFHGID